MKSELDAIDFALDELPGETLHETLRQYRERGDVQPTRFMGTPAFVITSHAALQDAFLDEEAFPGHLMYAASFEPAIGKSFISEQDPERHLRYRKLATPAFRSRAVTSYERTGLAELAHELVDRIGDRDEFDLVHDFTARFPYLVISRLLGLFREPDEAREKEEAFHTWALALLRFRDDPESARTANASLSEFLAPIVEDRRRAPRNDVISELVQAEVDGRRLTDEEIFSHIRLLFPTGGETTHGSLGNLLYALLTQQDQWRRTCREQERIDAVVLEGLRWDTPIAVLPRLSRSEPVVFHGVEIPPDCWVLFAIAGANRDPKVVQAPDRFDPERRQHGSASASTLVFGRGPKSCPGLHLAKKNMSVALQVLCTRLPDIELADAREARPRRTVLRCPDALRVRRTG